MEGEVLAHERKEREALTASAAAGHPPGAAGPAPEPDAAAVLLRRAMMLALLSAGVAALLALVYALALPRQYPAQTLIALAPLPPVEAALLPATGVAPEPGEDLRIALLKQRMLEALRAPVDLPWVPRERSQFSVPDYVQLFESDQAVAQVRDFLNAQRRRPLSLEQVRRQMDARGRILMQTRDSVVYQEIIELRFTAANAELAAAGANYWAEVCKGLVHAMQAQRRTSMAQDLALRADALRRQLDEGAANAPLVRHQLAQLESYQAMAGPAAPGVVVVAPAVAPQTAVGPQRLALVLAAGMLGALFALAVFLGLRALNQYTQPSPQED